MSKILDIQFNLKEGRATIADDILGTRQIDFTDTLAVIRDQYRYLKNLQCQGNKTAHLRRDIRVYKYILDHDSPEVAAKQYMEMAQKMRDEGRTISVEKMAVAKRLGWNV